MITDTKINKEASELYYRSGYWTEDTIREVWSRSCAAYPQKIYVKDDHGTSFTYQECDDRASRIASWLLDVGVKPGDVVTFQLATWAEFCPIFLGIAKIGAVMHPVPRNYSVADLTFVMNEVQTAAFICPTSHRHTDHEQQAIACLKHVNSLARERILLVEKNGCLKTSDLPTMGEIVERYSPATNLSAISSDSIACILSTSGTTGKPKQVLLTHNNILFSERVFVGGLHLDESDIMFMPSPLNHATGFFHGLIAPLLLGGTTILQQDFNADQAVSLMNREHVTWSMGATPFICDIVHSLEVRDTSIPSLKLFLSGGAPLPSILVKRAASHDILLCECYGSTESCPHAYVPPEKCTEWGGNWSGIALRGIDIRIVDENHREVPFGVQGEEASRGPCIFVGYLNDQQQTDAVLDDDGWFYSGDLAVMDEQGRFRITGRKKEIIIRGGENISAREVDNAIAGWPGIVDHATVGVPDDRMGERICLFTVSAPNLDHELRLEDLQDFLRKKGVSKRLWPERIELIEAIPRTESGKVNRYALTNILAKRLEDNVRARRDER